MKTTLNNRFNNRWMLRCAAALALTLAASARAEEPPSVPPAPMAPAANDAPKAPELPDAPVVTPDKAEKSAYLGVSAKPVSDELGAQLDLPHGVGLVVATVDQKGPSATDLHVHDVLQKLDDQLLIDADQLVTLIHLHHPGDSVTLSIVREAKPMQVTVKLGEKNRVALVTFDMNFSGDDLNALPGVKVPDELTSRIPYQTQLQLGGDSAVVLSFRDEVYSADVSTDKAGHRQLIVRDASGKTVTQCPIDTDEDWSKLAPEVRSHLDVMRKMVVEHPKVNP